MAVGAAETSADAREFGVGLEVEAGPLVGQGLAGLAEDLGDVQVGNRRDLVLRRDPEAVQGHPAQGRSPLPQRGEDLGHRAGSGMGELGVPFRLGDVGRVGLVGGALGQGMLREQGLLGLVGQAEHIEHLQAAPSAVAFSPGQVVGGQGA